jgi:hypothetical protein
MRSADPPIRRGVYGLRPQDRLRLVLGAEHVCRLGPRVLGELLIEVADDFPSLLGTLDDLRRLSSEVAQAIGADDWTTPIRVDVRGRRAA